MYTGTFLASGSDPTHVLVCSAHERFDSLHERVDSLQGTCKNRLEACMNALANNTESFQLHAVQRTASTRGVRQPVT